MKNKIEPIRTFTDEKGNWWIEFKSDEVKKALEKFKPKNKKMYYRIIIETEAGGKKWYYVQRRYLLYFWRYLREVRDISMHAYKIVWHSLEEAEAHIQSDVNARYANDQKKIVKREYIIR